MKITIIGTGYIGLVTGACLAEIGHHVLCIDCDEKKILQLQQGIMPIYEPNLHEIVNKNVEGKRLYFSADFILGVDWADIQIIAVNTPIDENNVPNLQSIFHVAKNIAKHMKGNKIIVNKCTVPVGTLYLVKQCIVSELKIRDAKFSVSIVANPEFLKEGEAINDFMNPARIVLGVEDKETKKILFDLYAPLGKNPSKIIFTSIKNAEFAKYAANCMLATRISFMNEMANFADKLDVNIDHVQKIMGSDPRIGRHFLSPGCGYGGSCLPKDIRTLIHIGQSLNQSMELLKAVEKINNKQKNIMLEMIQKRFGNVLKDKHFAIWGLAFKANTSDMRESASIEMIHGLLKMSATIAVYDPFAMLEAKKIFKDAISYATTVQSVLVNADALIILTDCAEFKKFNLTELKKILKHPIIFDGRNVYSKKNVKKFGLEYYNIGHGVKDENCCWSTGRVHQSAHGMGWTTSNL